MKRHFAGGWRLLAAMVVGVVCLASAPAAQADLLDGLKDYWTFDEGSGTTAADSWGTNNGTIYGGMTLGAPGRIGTAFSFNGSDAYVGTGKSLLNSMPAVTIAGWVKAKAGGGRVGLYGQNDLNEAGIDNQIAWWTSSGSFLTAPYPEGGAFPWANWHQIAYVADSTGHRIFVDGAQVASNGTAAPNATNAFPFNIGGGGIWDTGGNWFNGSIDEVALWNRALTPAEVSQIYNGGAGLRFLFQPSGTTLTWDGDNNNWNDLIAHTGNSHWTGGAPAQYPKITGFVGDQAIVNSGISTVTANEGAYSLDLGGTGSVVIAPSQSLRLLTNVNTTGTGALTIQNGGKLVAGGGTLLGVSVSGTATIENTGTLSIASLSDGGIAANFVKGGSGTLSLGSVSAVAGTTFKINGGTLSAQTPKPLGDATQLTLNGGTFQVSGITAPVANILRERLFDYDGGGYIDPIDSGTGYLTRAAWPGDPQGYVYQGMLTSGLAFNGDHWQNAPGNFGAKGLNGWDQIGGVWFGQMTLGGASPLPGGTEITLATASDDGSVFWVDKDKDGVFSHSGALGDELVVNNNYYQGTTWRYGTMNLPDGAYNVAIGFYEGGGGEWMEARYAVGNTVGNPGAMTVVQPGAAGQANLWAAIGIGAIDMSSTNVSVTANSGIQATTDGVATFGNLDLDNGTTLTTGGGKIVFQQGIINGGPGKTATLSPSNELTLKSFTDGGVASTLIMGGGGNLILQSVSAIPGTTFRVNAGTLTGVDASQLGSSTSLILGGGTYEALSTTGSTALSLTALNVSVVANSGLKATTSSTATFGNLTINPGFTLTLSGGKILFPTTAFGAGSSIVVGGNGAALGNTTTNGNANLGGTGTATAATYNDQGVANSTMRIYGGATLALDNTGGGRVTANNTIFRIEGASTLDATGELPLGTGTTRVTLAGGTGRFTPVPGNSNLGMTSTNLSVVANSTLNAVTSGRADFGHLTFDAGATLTTQGAGGGMYFQDTAITAPGFAGFAPQTRTWTGPLNGGGQSATLFNQGPSDLVLNQPGTNLANTMIEARGGRTVIIGPGPVAGAKLNVAGGEFVFASPDGKDVTIPNAITSTKSGTITAGTGGVAPMGRQVILPNLLPTDGSIITLRDEESCIVLPNGISRKGLVPTNDALGHFGFNRYPGDQAMMDLNGNAIASMMHSGVPGTHPNLTGRSLLTAGPGGRGLNFDSDADFMAAVNVPANDYCNLWVGILHVTDANKGDWQFRDADRDDWSGIWIDRNQNGVFDSTPPGLGSDRGEQLEWNDGNARTVNLATGNYLIGFTHLEGGGDSRMEFRFKSPTMGGEATIKPSDPTQAGLWSTLTPLPGGIDVAKGQIITLKSLDLGSITISGGDLIRNGTDVPGGDRNITVSDFLTLGGGKNLAMTQGAKLTTTGATLNINAGSTLWIDHPVDAANLNIFGNLVRIGSPTTDITATQSLTLNSTLDMTTGGALNTAGASISVGSTGKLTAAAPLIAKSLTTSGNVAAPGATLTSLLLSGGTTTLKGDTTITGELKGGSATLATQGNMSINAQTASLVNFAGQLNVQSGNLTLNLPAAGALPAGLQLDLDARAITGVGSGGRVAYWGDLSGKGHPADNVSGNPTLNLSGPNGQPVVKFYASDGSDGLWTTFNFDTLGTAYSVFAVSRYTGGYDGRVVSSMDHNDLFGHHGGGDERWHMEGWIGPAGGNNNTNWHVYSGTMDSSNQGNFWKDGTQLAFNSTGANPNNNRFGRLELGHQGGDFNGGNGEPSNAEVGEVLLFDRVLSAAERDAVASYLGSRYGVSGYPAASFADPSYLGDLKMAPSTQVSLPGGPAKFNSIAATGGPSIAGPLTLAGGGNATVNAPANTLTLNATVSATNFQVTGPGTVALKQNLTVNSGALSVASNATLSAQNTLTVDASAASVSIKGGLNVADASTLTFNVPPGGAAPSGLQLHLDASALVGYSNGQTVTNWTDKSGAGHDANQVQSDPAYTTGVLNGLPVVRFDGDDWLRTAYNFDPLTNYSILSVARYTGGDSERVISSGTRNWLFGFHGDGIERWHAEGWIYNNQVAAGNTDWQLHAGTMGPATNNPTASFWRNGNLLTSGNQGSGDNNYMIGTLQLNGQGGGELSNADIAEILIFDRVLSADELNNVGGYLATKYGLSSAYTGGFGPVSLGNLTLRASSTLKLNNDGLGAARFESITTTGATATIQGKVGLNGPVTVGNSPGTLTVTGDLTMGTGSTYNWETQGTGLGNSDLIAISGDLGATANNWTLSVNPLKVVPKSVLSTDYKLFSYGTGPGSGALFPKVSVKAGNAYAELLQLDSGKITSDGTNLYLNVQYAATRLWTGLAGTAWSGANWTDEGGNAAGEPDATIAAVINTNLATATVSTAGRKASTLIVGGYAEPERGALLIDTGGALTVTNKAHVLPTGTLTVLGTLGAAQLNTAGTTTFGPVATVNVPAINVTGGTTTGLGTPLGPTTTLTLTGGLLAGSFESTNPSKTPGSYAFEIQGGTVNAALRGNTASLRRSGSAAVVFDGPITLDTMSVEAGTTTINDNETLRLNTLNVSAGSLTVNRPSQIGTANLSGGTTTSTRNMTVTKSFQGGGTYVADGAQVMDLSSTTTISFGGELRVLSSSPANSGNLTVIIGSQSSGMPAGNLANWKFDDNTANDSSGNAYHGTLVNNPLFSTDVPAGHSGKSLDLTGGGNPYVVVDAGARNGDLDGGTAMTITAWVKGWPGGWNPFVCKNGEPNGWQMRRHGGDNTLDWTTRGVGPNNGDFAGISQAVANGNWHMVTMTYDGAAKTIYVDGAYDNSEACTGTIAASPQLLAFGARMREWPGVDGYFNGKLDDIMFFKRALSASEVSQLYSGAGFMPSLGNLKLGAGSQFTLGGTGQAAFTSIGTLGSVTISGGLTLAGAIPKVSSENAQNLTVNGTLTAKNVQITGPGTVTLTDRLAVTAGGMLTVPKGVTLASRGSNVVIDAPSASFNISGKLNVADGTLTVNLPAPNPTMPSGLAIHLDASALGLKDGDKMSTWTDTSGAGHPLTQRWGDANRYPTYRSSGFGPNDMPNVSFDGNDILQAMNYWQGNGYTAISVALASGGHRLVDGSDGTWIMGYDDGRESCMHWNGWMPNDDPNGAMSLPMDATPRIYAATGGPGGTGTNFYRNGSLISTDTNKASAIGNLCLGGWWDGGEEATGRIAEVLVFNRILSAAELNNVGGYLAARYGLPTGFSGFLGAPNLGNLTMAPATLLNLNGPGNNPGDPPIPGSGTARFTSIASGHEAQIIGNVIVDNLLDPTGKLTIRKDPVSGFGGDLQITDGMIYKFDLTRDPMDLIDPDTIHIDKSFTLQLFGAGATIQRDDKIQIFQFDPHTGLWIGGTPWDGTDASLNLAALIEVANFDDPYHQYVWDTCDAALVHDDQGIYLTGLLAELIPEPTSLALLALGGLALLRRRRARKSA